MAEFVSTLLRWRVPGQGSLDGLSVYFDKAEMGDWSDETGGIIQCLIGGVVCSILVVTIEYEAGIMLAFELKMNDSGLPGQSFYSVIRADAPLKEMVVCNEDMHFPRNCFLRPRAAWRVVQEYLNNPLVVPRQTSWISGNQIPSDLDELP